MRVYYDALRPAWRVLSAILLFIPILFPAACVGPPKGGKSYPVLQQDRAGIVRRVRCLYDQKPWLNLDRAGDRDPEGIRFRAFLDPGNGVGVHREGTFHVEMYLLKRQRDGKMSRDLVSDWHYPSHMVHRIAKPGKLGDGYYLYLRWAKKEIAGSEIEVITQFEDANGNVARSGTKRLAVPKYTS